MLAGACCEYVFIGRYRVLLTADEKIGVLINFQTGALILSSLIRIFMMLKGFSIIEMQLAATFIYVLRVILIRLYIKKKYPTADYKHQQLDTQKIDNYAVVVHNISNIAVINIPFIMLYLFTNLKVVSIYAVYALIFNAIYSILSNVFMQAAVASFGKITAQEDQKSLNKSSDSFQFLYIIAMSGFYLSASILILPFVKLYTNGVANINYYNPILVILLTAYGFIYALRVPALTIVYASGRFKDTVKGAAVEMILSIVLSIVFMVTFEYIGQTVYKLHGFGLYGLFIGFIISAFYRTVDLIIYANHKILLIKSRLILKRILINVLLVIATSLLLNQFSKNISHNWASLIIFGGLLAAISFILVLIINLIFHPKKVKDLTNILKSAFKSGS